MSYVTQPLKAVDDWEGILNTGIGDSIDLLYLEAYDSVPSERLLRNRVHVDSVELDRSNVNSMSMYQVLLSNGSKVRKM